MIVFIIIINYSPGAYEHDVHQNRRIEFAEAFGGKKTLCATVTIKCTKGVPDIVSHHQCIIGCMLTKKLMKEGGGS